MVTSTSRITKPQLKTLSTGATLPGALDCGQSTQLVATRHIARVRCAKAAGAVTGVWPAATRRAMCVATSAMVSAYSTSTNVNLSRRESTSLAIGILRRGAPAGAAPDRAARVTPRSRRRYPTPRPGASLPGDRPRVRLGRA